MVIFGMRGSVGGASTWQGEIGKSLVSKFEPLPKVMVSARIAELWAGMVKLPQRSNSGPGRCKSTVTLSIWIGLAVVLSRRIAPPSQGGPGLRLGIRPGSMMLGSPTQGIGNA